MCLGVSVCVWVCVRAADPNDAFDLGPFKSGECERGREWRELETMSYGFMSSDEWIQLDLPLFSLLRFFVIFTKIDIYFDGTHLQSLNDDIISLWILFNFSDFFSFVYNINPN